MSSHHLKWWHDDINIFILYISQIMLLIMVLLKHVLVFVYLFTKKLGGSSKMKVWNLALICFCIEMKPLCIPFTSGINSAADRKRARYEFLSNDIKDAGFNCQTIPIEICSRGHINSRNRSSLASIFHTCQVKKYQQTIKSLSKLSLLGSYTVYNSRNSDSWNIVSLLKP